MKHSFQLNINILDNLQWLRNHTELCDVALLSKGKKLFAHSCILASHSPVLAAILQARLVAQNDWSILKPLLIQIDEENIETEFPSTKEDNVLELLIAFMYGETITIEDFQLDEIINFSKILGLSQHFQDTVSLEMPSANSSKKCRRKSNLFTNESNSNEKEQILNSNTDKIDDISISIDNLQNQNNDIKESTVVNIVTTNEKGDTTPSIDSLNDTPVGTFCKESDDSHVYHSMQNLDKEKILNANIERKHNRAEEKSLIINDTESWFANELLNPVEIEVIPQNYDLEAENIIENEKEDKDMLSSISMENRSSEMARKTSRMALSCQICSASFHRAHELVCHIKKEYHYSQICPLCFLQLNDYIEQRVHFLQHDHPLPFFCFCCDLRFRSRAGLSMHAPKHSSTKPYLCKECGRGFKWRHAAQAHTVTHRKHCHLLCDICGFSSKYTSTFNSHLKRHYDQFFPCPYSGCNFKSFRKANLNDHIATHNKLRSHQCEVCGHSFSHAKNLKRHMRLHAPDSSLLKCAPLSKTVCKFGTTRLDKLRSHLIKKHNIISSGTKSLIAATKTSEKDDNENSSVTNNQVDENLEAVCALKTVTFEESNREKELFVDSILSSASKNSSLSSSNINDLFVKTGNEDSFTSPDYEAYLISTEEVSDDFKDESTEVVQSPLVLMEGIEVDKSSPCNMDHILNSLPVVINGNKSLAFENQVVFDECSNIDDFPVSPSTEESKRDNQNLQLINYLPKIKTTDGQESESSSINVLLEPTQNNFETLPSERYLEFSYDGQSEAKNKKNNSSIHTNIESSYSLPGSSVDIRKDSISCEKVQLTRTEYNF